MPKEVVLDHKDIENPQTITEITQKAIKDAGLDPRKVVAREDDGDGEYPKGKRILKVKNTKYFDMGRGKR